MLLVVSCGILDVVVILNTTRRNTPLSIKINDCITALCALGGDHDDTVSTTRTIEGVRSSILQYGHRLDIRRVDVVHAAAIRNTVEDNQRSLTCVDRTETADTDCRAIITRRTRRVRHLNTGNLTIQRVHSVSNLRCSKLLSTNNGSRTGKCLLLGGTEGHYDDLFDSLTLFENGINRSLTSDGHFCTFVTDKRELENTVSGSLKYILTGSVSSCSDSSTLNCNCSTCYRGTCIIGNCTRNLLVLCLECEATHSQYRNN